MDAHSGPKCKLCKENVVVGAFFGILGAVVVYIAMCEYGVPLPTGQNTVKTVISDADTNTVSGLKDGDIVIVKVKYYPDKIDRWEDVSGTKLFGDSEMPDGWIPGDPKYQLFYYRYTGKPRDVKLVLRMPVETWSKLNLDFRDLKHVEAERTIRLK